EASAGVSIRESMRSLGQLRSTGELLALADGRGTTRAHRRAEQRTVTLAERIAAVAVAPIPAALVQQEADQLDEDLKANGGALAGEQRQAVELACSDRGLVVIEGQ